jgi:AraC-like DNA-binding protein
VGLSDESHFVRDFETVFGLSPAKFRLSLRRRRTKQAGAGH